MEPIAVPVGTCLCAGTPHTEGDTVYLRQKLGLAAGIEVQQAALDANKAGASPNQITGILSESFLAHGIVSWTLVDEDGTPTPVTPETIADRILSDFAIASPLADRADTLYSGPVLDPLLNPAPASSNGSSTARSTSRTQRRGKAVRKPSRPSSTSTTSTAVTAMTTG